MNLHGVLVGIAAFLVIGLFHPLVIKAEYYLGVRAWPLFLILGLAAVGFSLFLDSLLISAILGLLGFSSLWSIREIFEQARRVEKGWFPENPNRKR